MNVRVGEIVRPLKGHDVDWFHYVIKTEGDYLYLVNGKQRTVAAPKKKREKHVSSMGLWTHPVTEHIQQGVPVLDSEIRRALAAFRDKFSETKEV